MRQLQAYHYWAGQVENSICCMRIRAEGQRGTLVGFLDREWGSVDEGRGGSDL